MCTKGDNRDNDPTSALFSKPGIDLDPSGTFKQVDAFMRSTVFSAVGSLSRYHYASQTIHLCIFCHS